MRRLAAAPLATLLATTLLLAGCAGGDDPEVEPTPSEQAEEPTTPEASPEDIAALEDVEVEGDLGAAPTVTFEQPFSVSQAVARVDSEGDGDTLEAGHDIEVNYVAISGEDGSELADTWALGQPEVLTLSEGALFPALLDAFIGQKVGARVVFASPGTEAQAATETTPEQPAEPTTVLTLEVVSAKFPRAEGEAVVPPAGLPLVELADNGEPEIEIPADVTEPTELVVQPLIQGTGPIVESGQSVRIHYKGWLWDGTLFDSSWTSKPLEAPIGVGQLIAGWDEGVVGQAVGSQLLLVVPSDKGYGPDGYGEIPGGATLVFVVDILSATGGA